MVVVLEAIAHAPAVTVGVTAMFGENGRAANMRAIVADAGLPKAYTAQDVHGRGMGERPEAQSQTV